MQFAVVDQHDLLQARQMQALSLAVHIPLVCFGIALPAMILFCEWRGLRGDPIYRTLAPRGDLTECDAGAEVRTKASVCDRARGQPALKASVDAGRNAFATRSSLSRHRRVRAWGSYAWSRARASRMPSKCRPLTPSSSGEIARRRVAATPSSTLFAGAMPASRTIFLFMKVAGWGAFTVRSCSPA